jgi:hypothetical protein
VKIIINYKNGLAYICSAFEKTDGVRIMENFIEYFKKMSEDKNNEGDEKEVTYRASFLILNIYQDHIIPDSLKVIYVIMRELLIEFGKTAKKESFRVESLITPVVNGISCNDIVILLFTLDILCKREENITEVISNDIAQALLEWAIVSDEYDVYLKNPNIKHNASVILQKICNCECSSSIELLFKKNILEYIAVTLKSLAATQDFKYINLLYKSISFLVERNEFKKYFFKNDKITFITVVVDFVNFLWKKQIRTELEDEYVFRGVLIILKVYSAVVERTSFPNDFIWMFKILKEIVIIFGKAS